MSLTHIEAADGGEIIVVKVVEWIWMFGSTAVQRKEFEPYLLAEFIRQERRYD